MTTERQDLSEFIRAVQGGDSEALRDVLRRFPALRQELDEPHFAFDTPAVVAARGHPDVLDVLLEHGADINTKSRWWAGGFGVLDFVALTPEDDRWAEALIARGAVVGAHAAAGLGRIDRLRQLLDADPGLVHSRGGDGQTPLHFARTVEVASLLLDRGADIDARDVDHESTPAQYRVKDSPDVARFLVARGCQTDILLAAALGDLPLVQRLLAADPAVLHLRVTHDHFPCTGLRAGGHIYQWTLGLYLSPHQVARQFGHTDVYEYLLAQSPPPTQLVEKCWEGDLSAVDRLLVAAPHAKDAIPPADSRLIAHAARNNLPLAVRAFLRAGFPIDATSQHGATALHWAAFHGEPGMTENLLQHRAPLELTDCDFHGTPLGWAAHGSTHGWYASKGDYARTATLLLAAGARPNASMLRVAAEPVARILRQALGHN